MSMKKILIAIFIFVAALSLSSVFSVGLHRVSGQAGSPPAECATDNSPDAVSLCGFAWGGTDEGAGSGVGDTGIGWLSFNAEDCDKNHDGMTDTNIPGCPAAAVPTSQYKVTVSTDGTLKGCAWSPNIGWVKFGGNNALSGNPTPAGNEDAQAKLVSGSNNPAQAATTLTGWARACAGTASGDCSDMTSRSDGWDGWISLKNAISSSATVSLAGGMFSGNAWGGEVVGWLNWNAGNGNPVRFCSVQPFDFALTGPNSVAVERGKTVTPTLAITKVGAAASQQVTLTAEVITAPPTGALTLTLNPTTGNPSFATNLSIGTSSDVPLTQGAQSPYLVRVTGTAGAIVHTKDIAVNVADAVVSHDLVLSCSAPADGGFVNKPIPFTAAIASSNATSSPTTPFFFTLDGNDPTSASRSSSDNPLTGASGLTKTFSTIGKKTVTIKVWDSSDPVAKGTCMLDVLVKVATQIIEK